MNKGYKAIVKVALELGLPKYYETDLFVVDRAVLEVFNPEKFAWTIYVSGSGLDFVQQPNNNSHASYFWAGSQDAHIFWFDGETLTEVTLGQLPDLLITLPPVTQWTEEQQKAFQWKTELYYTIEAERLGRERATYQNDVEVILDYRWKAKITPEVTIVREVVRNT